MSEKRGVRDLLGGRIPPVPRAEAWATILNTRCGERGKEVAADVLKIYGDALSEQADIPAVKRDLHRCVYIAIASVLTAAQMAKFLHLELEKIDSAETRNAHKISAEVAFRTAFAMLCRQLGVAAVLEDPVDTTAAMRTRWLAALADLHKDGRDEQESVDLREGMGTLNAMFWPLLHRETAFLFKALPVNGRALYLRCILSLAEGSAAQVTSTLREQFPTDAVTSQPSQLEQNTTLPPDCMDGGEDNLLRHYRRWNYFASMSIAVVSALQAALLSAKHDQNNTTAPDPAESLRFVESPNQPLPEGQGPEYVQYIELAVEDLESEHIFLGNGWVTSAPGMRAQSSSPETPARSDKSDGIRFLTSAMQNTQSVYRMPRADDAQRVWESWFEKVLALELMFKDLPAQLSIPMLTGHLKTDDRRIYGWHDIAIAMNHANQQPTLHQFVAHVKTQVLATNTTRREAKLELDRLVTDFSGIPDCSALKTKLKQLWAQLYPPNTDEVEPMTKLAAMKQVFALLMAIRFKGKVSQPMVKAWRDFTLHDSPTMFSKYIDEGLHVRGASDQLAVQYLNEVYDQLDLAHRMFVQVGAIMSSQDASSHKQVADKPIVAAAKLLNVTPQVVATWIDSTGPPGSKKRAREPAASTNKKKKAFSQPTSKTNGSTTKRSNSKMRAAMASMKVLSERQNAPDLMPGVLRGDFPNLEPLEYDEAVRLVEGGACTLCMLPHKHTDCKSAALDGQKPAPELLARITKYNKAFRGCLANSSA
jgi:hypothetical protein